MTSTASPQTWFWWEGRGWIGGRSQSGLSQCHQSFLVVIGTIPRSHASAIDEIMKTNEHVGCWRRDHYGPHLLIWRTSSPGTAEATPPIRVRHVVGITSMLMELRIYSRDSEQFVRFLLHPDFGPLLKIIVTTEVFLWSGCRRSSRKNHKVHVGSTHHWYTNP